MALTDDLKKLRDGSLAALDASHNYYTHTKGAWRFVQEMVRQGQKVSIRNQAPGSIVNEQALPGLAQEYVTGYLASATFQHFVSLFEDFVFGFLRAWLIEHPGSLSAKQLQFRTVLQSADKAQIVRAVIEKHLVELAYDRVDNWFEYLEKTANLGCPNQDQVQQLAEIKASRDVLVYNKGIANSIYVDKSMGRARVKDGEPLEIPEQYHRESWQLIRQVVSDIAQAGINKLGKRIPIMGGVTSPQTGVDCSAYPPKLMKQPCRQRTRRTLMDKETRDALSRSRACILSNVLLTGLADRRPSQRLCRVQATDLFPLNSSSVKGN